MPRANRFNEPTLNSAQRLWAKVRISREYWITMDHYFTDLGRVPQEELLLVHVNQLLLVGFWGVFTR